MLVLLYLILMFLFGLSISYLYINEKYIYESLGSSKMVKELPSFLLVAPIGILIGIILVPITNYYIIYLIHTLFKSIHNYYAWGISITSLLFIGLTIYNFYIIRKKKNIFNYKNCFFYLIITAVVICLSYFLMFYTYKINDNLLMVAPSTFSDMSPHTAMTSSFGIGNNIPTNYMHFGNDGIKYHFMFYFLAGLLNYMGMRIDLALNIPSIIVMAIAITMASVLATLFSKHKVAFLITPLLIFFRSSFNFIIVIARIISNHGNIIKDLFTNSVWYDITPYDKWGIWAINVYSNQRHLMLGMAVILTFVIVLLPYVKATFKGLDGNHKIFKTGVFSKEAWCFSKQDRFAIPLILLTICMPYFHGSALITYLLILFGMAIFSQKKLIYLIIAIAAITSSVIQTNFFSGGANQVVSFIFNPGFVLSKYDIISVIIYLLIMSGVAILVALGYSLKKFKKEKYILYLFFCFLLPIVFAFSFKITIEVLANHKFIHFAIILLDTLIAAYMSELLCVKKNKFNYLFVFILLILLTGTGITEWATFININKNKVIINYSDPAIDWIKENTNPDDVFLTPMWALNSFFLSGRATFYGWPYYPWSAGHDTDNRFIAYKNLLGGMDNDIATFVGYCKNNKIKYFIDSPEYYGYEATDNIIYNRDYIVNNLELCASFNQIKIYKIY